MDNDIVLKSCFFTGHRIIANEDKPQLRNKLKNVCMHLIENEGVTRFISGGALGFDTIAAETVLDLKKRYPNISLHLYLPCTNQTARWRASDVDKWNKIKTLADEYKYIVNMPYIAGCMQLRNKAMVNDAKFAVAYCTKSFGGTYSTIKYAQDKNRKIFLIK